jgi:hypothetical protein
VAASPPGAELLLAGPAQILQLVAFAVVSSLRGRRRTYVIDGHEISMEIEDLTLNTGLGLAVGQFDDIRLLIKDVEWQGRRVSSLAIVASNVHLRPGIVPTLVAAPVTFGATVRVDDIATWVPEIVRHRVEVDIDDDAVARVRWKDRPHLGALEMDVRVEGPFLVLDPTTFVAGTRRFSRLKWIPPLRLPIVLPRDIIITDVSLEPGAVHVAGQLPQLTERLKVTDVQQFVRNLTPDVERVVIPRAG